MMLMLFSLSVIGAPPYRHPRMLVVGSGKSGGGTGPGGLAPGPVVVFDRVWERVFMQCLLLRSRLDLRRGLEKSNEVGGVPICGLPPPLGCWPRTPPETGHNGGTRSKQSVRMSGAICRSSDWWEHLAVGLGTPVMDSASRGADQVFPVERP